jgi:hypothetical protein
MRVTWIAASNSSPLAPCHRGEPLDRLKPRRIVMKTLVSLAVALGLVASAALPAFAANAPKTKAECEKAHMKWDATAKKCS